MISDSQCRFVAFIQSYALGFCVTYSYLSLCLLPSVGSSHPWNTFVKLIMFSVEINLPEINGGRNADPYLLKVELTFLLIGQLCTSLETASAAHMLYGRENAFHVCLVLKCHFSEFLYRWWILVSCVMLKSMLKMTTPRKIILSSWDLSSLLAPIRSSFWFYGLF